MESKDDHGSENPLLVVEDAEDAAESGPKLVGADSVDLASSTGSFKRWIGYFRTKRAHAHQPQRFVEGWPVDSQDNHGHTTLSPFQAVPDQQWEIMSGHSSHLGTVKTTSLSGASRSAVRSRGNTQSTVNPRSSSEIRRSNEMESLKPARSPSSLDEETQARGINRRQVIQEILTTETDYVLGLKALTGVLSMFLTRPAIYHNVQQIREIHEDFLAQLHLVTPSTSAAADAELPRLMTGSRSKRSTVSLRGLQHRSLRTRKFKQEYDARLKLMTAEPGEARDVAHEIDKLARSSTAYVNFCGNFELLKQDMDILRASVFNWSFFDQGIEALSKSVAPMENRRPEEHKSMTVNDLLIKPVQRVCRYHLLLQELSKYTPSSDCPSSYNEIKQVADNLRALASQVNSAANRTNRIRQTILLQKKLVFPGSTFLQDVYKQLGPMNMCGVLHVTYRLPEHIAGAYMVCALFEYYLLLAKPIDDGHSLQVVACVYVWDIKFDTLRNGYGMRCYGLFSWKMVFQHRDEKYELVLSASMASEERHWKSEIMKSTDKIEPVPLEPRKCSIMALALVPFERSAASFRAPSTSCAATGIQHVYIKRTHNPNSYKDTILPGEDALERSKGSVPDGAVELVTNRQDRVRLEYSLSDVYTRDLLPYPGMDLGKQNTRFRSFRIPGRSTSLGTAKGAVARPMQIHPNKSAEAVKTHKRVVSQDRFPYDDEKRVILLEDQPEEKPQAAAIRLRTASRETSKSHTWSLNRNSKSLKRFGNLSRKASVLSFFQSLPMRKTRGSRPEVRVSCET